MILYLDTSAYLKLFIPEEGSATVAAAVAAATQVTTHLITYPEMCAAFAKARRMGRESVDAVRRHTLELQAHWRQIMVVMPDEAAALRAGELALRYNLRGYDSVHLAAAESIGNRVRNRAEFLFGAFDRQLVAAARDLGLAVL